MGWGVLAAIGFILTYAICYNIWASFAYPFYLDYMHYTKDEVAFASKIFGIIMTMLGISLGGYLFAKIGRFPTILLGAILPPLGNFLYADLADGAPMIDGFAHLLAARRPGARIRQRRADDAAADRDLLREHHHRPRAHRLRRLRLQHRQQEIWCDPVRAARLAAVAGRDAWARRGRRGIRYLRLCARCSAGPRRRRSSRRCSCCSNGRE